MTETFAARLSMAVARSAGVPPRDRPGNASTAAIEGKGEDAGEPAAQAPRAARASSVPKERADDVAVKSVKVAAIAAAQARADRVLAGGVSPANREADPTPAK